LKHWSLRLALVAFLLAGFFLAQPSPDHSLFSELGIALEQWQLLVKEQPIVCGIGFLLIYVLATGLSIPGAAGFMLVAGGLFGFGWGLFLASFGSSLGALIAFLLFRAFLPRWTERKFPRQVEKLRSLLFENPGREGELLFLARLFPVVPYFLVNIAFSLSRIQPFRFYLISQLGMLPVTILYVAAGRELATSGTIGELISPLHLSLFLAIALLPGLLRYFGKRYLP
jgi:uncharacterized membrane protein YdjX (TVP38/TMEM64 family)